MEPTFGYVAVKEGASATFSAETLMRQPACDIAPTVMVSALKVDWPPGAFLVKLRPAKNCLAVHLLKEMTRMRGPQASLSALKPAATGCFLLFG
ncbi:hypothetical protein [Burkholderia cepacia]|uniref:hypothetical protein n=1 Tax=Burkholderia cepacia TaxID=292 RepID=UPI0026E0D9EC|nr:hypothetical protein [Burkholderia cepacia]MDO5947587.1 hypothetical protein [Burkholderia cepacia]